MERMFNKTYLDSILMERLEKKKNNNLNVKNIINKRLEKTRLTWTGL